MVFAVTLTAAFLVQRVVMVVPAACFFEALILNCLNTGVEEGGELNFFRPVPFLVADAEELPNAIVRHAILPPIPVVFLRSDKLPITLR